MTENESDWYPQAGIYDVDAQFRLDGDLQAVTVRVNFSEAKDYYYDSEEVKADGDDPSADSYEDGDVVDTDHRNGAHARIRFTVNEHGVAALSKFKDAESLASGSNWTGFDFLKVLYPAQQAVANVPGVESIQPPEDTLRRHLNQGLEAETYRM